MYFSFSYFTKFMILSEGKVKLVKTGKIFGNFNSCFREYINSTNYMYILADNEEEGLSYYQMRQPGII